MRNAEPHLVAFQQTQLRQCSRRQRRCAVRLESLHVHDYEVNRLVVRVCCVLGSCRVELVWSWLTVVVSCQQW